MATINLAIVIPDAQMPRVQAAMRANWGQALTNADLIERLRVAVMANITDITRRFEQDAAKATAVSGVSDVSTT